MKISRLNLFKALAGLGAAALLPKMEAAEAPGPNGGYYVPPEFAELLSRPVTHYAGTQYWQGEASGDFSDSVRIQSVAIYDRVLTDKEIMVESHKMMAGM